MKITLLGTGTPAPSLRRQSSGYLIAVADDLLIMDHGPGAHHRLLESGHRAVDVTHAFFSHLHYDHCLDYPRLVLQRWDQGAGRIPELEVFGPPPLARMTELLFSGDGVFGVDIRARTGHPSSLDVFHERGGGGGVRQGPAPRVREVRRGDVVEGRGWRVTVGPAHHVQPYLECLSFRLDAEEGSLCYSGDSGPCEGLVELARGCDVLVHMNNHLGGAGVSADFRAACSSHRDNAAAAREAGVGTLVLTHLRPDLDPPDVQDRLRAEIGEEFEGRVVFGEDLMELTIP